MPSVFVVSSAKKSLADNGFFPQPFTKRLLLKEKAFCFVGRGETPV